MNPVAPVLQSREVRRHSIVKSVETGKSWFTYRKILGVMFLLGGTLNLMKEDYRNLVDALE